MGIYNSLRNEFSRHRKRKGRSLDGSIPGAPYNRFRRPTTRPLGSVHRGGGYAQKSYLEDLPREYHPNINAPAAQSIEYKTTESGNFPVFNKTPDTFEPFSPDLPDVSPHVFPTVEDELSQEEQFLMNRGESPRPQEGPVEVPMEDIRHLIDGVWYTIPTQDSTEDDTLSPAAEILASHPSVSASNMPFEELPDHQTLTETIDQLRGVLPEDHPDIVNLETALQRMEEQQEQNMNTEVELDYTAFEHDPIEEAQQLFDQQLHAIDQAFEMPEIIPTDDLQSDMFEYQQAEFDMMLEQSQPEDPSMEQQGLEQIIEQADSLDSPEQPLMETEAIPGEMPLEMGVYGVIPQMIAEETDMNHAEIEQAMDQVSGQPMMEEPMPAEPLIPDYGPLLEDPSETLQYMLDPYLQQTMNPSMMPDDIGPMGPMPGPGM